MSKVTGTSSRKADHIRINLEKDVSSGLTTGLEFFRFKHNAVPELNLREIDTSWTFLGHELTTPLLISSMTGGTSEAGHLNRILAAGAQETGIAMALGSQRAMIEDASLSSTFQVRDEAPDILLLANLGAVQLNYGYGLDECRRAVEDVGANALVLHLNALQEAVQPEGDVNFDGLLGKIEKVCNDIEVPVVAKEVGWGISAETARKLIDAGVSAIDVAGAGGTSWTQVEMYRADTEQQAELAAGFLDWGIPTADALRALNQELPDTPLIASGGLRNGIDIAKTIVLGADLAGMASPYLKAADSSLEDLIAFIQTTKRQIEICMFATGAPDLATFKRQELLSIK